MNTEFQIHFISIWVCKNYIKTSSFQSYPCQIPCKNMISTCSDDQTFVLWGMNPFQLNLPCRTFSGNLSKSQTTNHCLWRKLRTKKRTMTTKKLTKVKCQKKNSDNFLVQKTSLSKSPRLSRCVTFLDEVKTDISDLEKFLEGARVNARIVPGHWLRVGMNTRNLCGEPKRYICDHNKCE